MNMNQTHSYDPITDHLQLDLVFDMTDELF